MSLPKLIEKLAGLMKQKGNSLANNTLYKIFITFGKKKMMLNCREKEGEKNNQLLRS